MRRTRTTNGPILMLHTLYKAASSFWKEQGMTVVRVELKYYSKYPLFCTVWLVSIFPVKLAKISAEIVSIILTSFQSSVHLDNHSRDCPLFAATRPLTNPNQNIFPRQLAWTATCIKYTSHTNKLQGNHRLAYTLECLQTFNPLSDILLIKIPQSWSHVVISPPHPSKWTTGGNYNSFGRHL